MAGTKGNRRTLYSKMVIKESLIKLLQSKEIHKITVTDLCKEADINRGTFYSYYNNPLDLLKNIENEFFDKIVEYLNEDSENQDKVTSLTKVLEMAKENKDLSKILLNNIGDDRILKRVLYIANQDDINTMRTYINDDNKAYIDYLTRFAVNGSIGIIESWLENDLKESPRTLAEMITKITAKLAELSINPKELNKH